MRNTRRENTRRIEFVVVGTMASAVPGSVCIYLGEAASLASDRTVITAMLVLLPFLFAVGATIGLAASFTHSSEWLVMIGAVWAWIPGLIVTGVIIQVLGLSREEGLIVLATLGIICGAVVGLSPSWIATWIAKSRERKG